MQIFIDTPLDPTRTKEDVLRAILHGLAYCPILTGTINGTVEVYGAEFKYHAIVG